MTDKSRESLDPAARPPAQDHRPRNNPDEHDPGRVRRHETPIGGDRVHDTEEDAAHSVASDVTPSELDMRVQSHWGIVKPASANVVRNIVRGSLITAPVIQFGKDRDGRRKRERGFYKSPLGMILIKRYPLVVYDVDLDERHLPKRLHCMQRHTYGGSGLRRGARLREDYHLHVKLVPPGRDKNDRGDAPNEPLIIERMYNSKKISENSYLEFRSICTVELDEYVVLDGHLEMDSWVRLFGLYMSTVSRTATQQLQKTPEFRRQIRDVFDDLTGDLDENEQRVAGAVSTDLIQRATSNNASLQSQQFPGERGEEIISTTRVTQNHHLKTREGNVISNNRQDTEVRHPRGRSTEETRRRRSRSPHGVEPERYRNRDDAPEYSSQPRYDRNRTQGYHARREERRWPDSRNAENRHTIRESRPGRQIRQSDYDLRTDRQYDRRGGRGQGRDDDMNMRQRGRSTDRGDGRR
ncbi:hypothetical protein CUC08_Gglean010285 [Alternaria sp. MG1]|jgi:hypothetical protein|uniref:Uncharacterized protein n=2 Tax=Alternaria alternata complex TaxID=187734 RepID=A0A4Q4S7E7_9PLEO|nr:hypothetical protein CUC08_Gglean010285 [Alternaria sp. MG1]RYN35289.1 hypothetical protein AA0115_g2316 [Alternaria tenuissima]RYN64114.1 hypothetical protein AA0118_g4030 [Alternaria tenuissima]RYN91999.1 hypothetical protein AA0120_g5452 [Alternaria tenuissima]RYO08591.1 hypothetical protein AA0119_g1336 [Alternaria tenuissima]